MPRPTAILVGSAHWLTAVPTVSQAALPPTIHDFGGFPDALYQMRYPAPGAPELAHRISQLIPDMVLHPSRGLDHGAWVPLKLIYPAADIPVLQISLQPERGPRHHFELGQKLAGLRNEDVLIIGSGSLTHNLYEVGTTAPAAISAATQFADWMQEKVEAADTEALLEYRSRAPAAVFNHPTDEHLLPLFVALGAGDAAAAKLLHRSMEFSILAMDAYRFG